MSGFGVAVGSKVVRRRFSSDEDARLRRLVETFGCTNWREVAKMMPNRTARQCREHYNNHLAESLSKEPWSREEDAIIVKKYLEIGPRWVEIARLLKGRSENGVKNRWHKRLRKSTRRRGLAANPVVEGRPAVDLGRAIGLNEMEITQIFGQGIG
jgi:hypothetical protein